MNAIELESLSKHFGKTIAVDEVNFNISKGEFFGLLGPNGAGKTTLINMLVGLATPTSGAARVFGEDIIKDYRKVHSQIGLAPGEENFDREFNVFENLVHHAGYFGIPKEESRRRTEKYLKMFDLWEKREVKPFHLSQGMSKKLLLARAMITDPNILILDEPTAGLDVTAKRETREHIEALNREGLTVVLTTHLLEEAEDLCGRVAIIDRGRIIAIGSPEKLVNEGKSDTVRIELKEEVKSMPKTIVQSSYQADIQNGGKELRIIAPDGGKAAVDAIHRLYSNGVRAESVNIEKADLEDVFTRLTET